MSSTDKGKKDTIIFKSNESFRIFAIIIVVVVVVVFGIVYSVGIGS